MTAQILHLRDYKTPVEQPAKGCMSDGDKRAVALFEMTSKGACSVEQMQQFMSSYDAAAAKAANQAVASDFPIQYRRDDTAHKIDVLVSRETEMRNTIGHCRLRSPFPSGEFPHLDTAPSEYCGDSGDCA